MAILAELQRRATTGGARGRSKGGMHGYFVLGAISPDDAANQIFPSARIGKSAGHNQSVWNQMRASAAAGQIVNAQGGPDYVPGTADCKAATGAGSSPAAEIGLAGKAGSLALTGVNAAGLLAAGPTLGISLAISSIIGIFSTIFNHHAQAVAKEQSVLCAAVPAANNYLRLIDQAVQAGQASPQQAIQALASLVSDFQSQVSSIIHGSDPTSSGECNAACVELSKLRAIVALKQSAYQDLAAAGGAGSTAGGSGPTTAPVVSSGSTLQIPGTVRASSPNWLGIAALVALGFLAWRTI